MAKQHSIREYLSVAVATFIVALCKGYPPVLFTLLVVALYKAMSAVWSYCQKPPSDRSMSYFYPLTAVVAFLVALFKGYPLALFTFAVLGMYSITHAVLTFFGDREALDPPQQGPTPSHTPVPETKQQDLPHHPHVLSVSHSAAPEKNAQEPVSAAALTKTA